MYFYHKKSKGVTIQMKPLQCYFHIVLLIFHIIVCGWSNVVLPFKRKLLNGSDFHMVLFVLHENLLQFLSQWMKPWRVTIQMKPCELSFCMAPLFLVFNKKWNKD